ncbi:MAG: hypothetical protein HY519_00570 [Candidatus Aenigmarchaeota archaeon]|nr:hypothetical protein [Candidatus Aenigmarchaeota archaeon]
MMQHAKGLAFASLLILLLGSAMAHAYNSGAASIKVSLLSYSPYPAEPGKHATLTFKVENDGSGDATDVRLKLSPEYPFSLDANATVKVKNSATSIPVGDDMIVSLGKLPSAEYTLIEYNVRVADGALEGSQEVQVWHQPSMSDVWIADRFDVSVQGLEGLEVSDVIPSTIAPGKPTGVIFILKNSGTAYLRNVAFTWAEKDNKILPLGSGNKKYIESIGPAESVQIPFTLVADPGVSSGAYTLSTDISYVIGYNTTKSLNVNVGMFVGGAGDFEVGLQDAQAGSVSLSIANVGSNPATSVTVRIPDQDDFAVTGSSSSFIGNLNPGDFTLASFQLASRLRNNQTQGGRPLLKVEIIYTDTSGSRQTVEKQVDIRSLPAATNQNGQGAQDFQGQGRNGQFQRSGSGYNLVAIGVVGIVLIAVLFRYRSKVKGLIARFRKQR